MSWVELGEDRCSRVEVGARFSNTRNITLVKINLLKVSFKLLKFDQLVFELTLGDTNVFDL